MSNEWDISIIRKIAGLNPIMESFEDDDDDEDPDVKVAAKDKRQAQFEKKNRNELTRAEKEAANKEKVDAKKKEEEKAKLKDEKKAEPKAEPKAEEKAEEKAEAKKRGRAPNPDAKAGKARAWLDAHPGATVGEFKKHAAEFGMTPHYASAKFYQIKHSKTLKECYMLSHPSMPSFMLAENREISQMQWVDPTSPLEPMIFETKEAAEKIVKYMSEWKSQYANIVTITLED